MAYESTVFRVLLTFPGDVRKEAEHLREVIEDWNRQNSAREGVVLSPVAWDTDAAPILGVDAQMAINMQIVNSADLLIGVFWSRMGTQTARAVSGSAEEVSIFRQTEKPAMLYFCSAPIPREKIDPQQLAALSTFRSELKGLVGEFADVHELGRKCLANLNAAVELLKKGRSAPEARTQRVMEMFAEIVRVVVSELGTKSFLELRTSHTGGMFAGVLQHALLLPINSRVFRRVEEAMSLLASAECYCVVYLHDGGGEFSALYIEEQMSPTRESDKQCPEALRPFLVRAMREGWAVLCDVSALTLNTSIEFGRRVKAANSVVVAPLPMGSAEQGVAVFFSAQAGAFSKATLSFAEAFASLLVLPMVVLFPPETP